MKTHRNTSVLAFYEESDFSDNGSGKAETKIMKLEKKKKKPSVD